MKIHQIVPWLVRSRAGSGSSRDPTLGIDFNREYLHTNLAYYFGGTVTRR